MTNLEFGIWNLEHGIYFLFSATFFSISPSSSHNKQLKFTHEQQAS